MQRKLLSKQKGHSELESCSREDLEFAGFNSGKRTMLSFLGAASMHSECVTAVKAQL